MQNTRSPPNFLPQNKTEKKKLTEKKKKRPKILD